MPSRKTGQVGYRDQSSGYILVKHIFGKAKLMIRRSAILFFILLCVVAFVAVSAHGEQRKEKGSEVLLIYSSGKPLEYYTDGPLFRTIREQGSSEIDTVTTATPMRENCRTISSKLALLLREKGLKVRVVNATEIRYHSEILSARLVIIGTPSRFSNVSWEIKKLFDEQFSKICVLEEKGLNKLRIAGFSMAEIMPSADAAVKAIRAAVRDSNGRFGPTMKFLTKHSEKEINKRINKFVDQLAQCVSHK